MIIIINLKSNEKKGLLNIFKITENKKALKQQNTRIPYFIIIKLNKAIWFRI